MKITEPVTMITDYIITIFTFYLAILLVQNYRFSIYDPVWSIIAVLLVTGLGAFLGGTSHGFKENLNAKQDRILWKFTTYTLGLAAFFLIVAATQSSISSDRIRQGIILLALVQLISYIRWMQQNDEFIYVIINYVLAMVVVIALKIYSFIVFSDPSSLWMIGGILISFIASGLQAFEIGIHPKYFNHNDLFHVVQLPGFYFIYRAATQFILF